MTAHRDEPGQTRTIAIVNGGPEMVLLLEAVVEPGAYQVEFVTLMSRSVHARLRAMAPDLIVLCTRIDDPAGFQLLSLLKLDPATRETPVLTFTTEYEGQEYVDSSQVAEDDEPTYTPVRAQFRMN
jgi:CheY-like chemotaxis protein